MFSAHCVINVTFPFNFFNKNKHTIFSIKFSNINKCVYDTFFSWVCCENSVLTCGFM